MLLCTKQYYRLFPMNKHNLTPQKREITAHCRYVRHLKFKALSFIQTSIVVKVYFDSTCIAIVLMWLLAIGNFRPVIKKIPKIRIIHIDVTRGFQMLSRMHFQIFHLARGELIETQRIVTFVSSFIGVGHNSDRKWQPNQMTTDSY